MESRDSREASGLVVLDAAFVVAVREVVRDVEVCSMTRWAFLKFRRESS